MTLTETVLLFWKSRGRGATSGESGLKPSRNHGGSFLTAFSLPSSGFCVDWETGLIASCPFLAAAIPLPPAAAPLGKGLPSVILGDALTPFLEAVSSSESAASSEQSAHHNGTTSHAAVTSLGRVTFHKVTVHLPVTATCADCSTLQ